MWTGQCVKVCVGGTVSVCDSNSDSMCDRTVTMCVTMTACCFLQNKMKEISKLGTWK